MSYVAAYIFRVECKPILSAPIGKHNPLAAAINTGSQGLFTANPTAVLYVKQMCEAQRRTIVTPKHTLQCKTSCLMWHGVEPANTLIIAKSHYKIMYNRQLQYLYLVLCFETNTKQGNAFQHSLSLKSIL